MNIKKKIHTLMNLDFKWAFRFYKKRLLMSIRFFFANNRIVSINIDGTNIKLVSSDAYHYSVAKDMSEGNYYEMSLLREWVEHTKKASVIFDFGAYNGLYGLLAAKANPNAKVYLFEIDPIAIKHIEENIRENALENIHLVPKAISSEDGEASFFVGATGGRLRKDGGLIVKTVSYKTLINEFGAPDLIKMDIEGGEASVIPSMKEHLGGKPKIFFELHSFVLDKKEEELVMSSLKDIGYTFSLRPDASLPGVLHYILV